jgi:hypothetical protein
MKAEADADLDTRWRRYERVRDRQDREESKYTHYCLEQCDLLGALAELEAKERAMFELQDGKDQCMTVLKLALANLGMWVRTHWLRLLPFFRLPGRVLWGTDRVEVELQAFNDRQLTRDLESLRSRVNTAARCLPDGRRLWLTVRCALPAAEASRNIPAAAL